MKGTDIGMYVDLADIDMAALEETIFPKCNKLPLYYWFLNDIWVSGPVLRVVSGSLLGT